MPSAQSRSTTPAYTPWRHTSELAMVRDWFYPSHNAPDPYSAAPPDMRQMAVQHVQMWLFKDSELPHAIIATANLTDAMLHDTLDRRKMISDWALKSVYAMAFCRFVNGFVDRDIAKAALRASASTKADSAVLPKTGHVDEAGASTTASRGENSMYAHAAAIGMPEQFVDLRHRATHDDMPSLEVLRQMARRGLDWLWERWWKVHVTDDPGRALREREERRALAEKKAQVRRVKKGQEGYNAGIDHEARARHDRKEKDEVFAEAAEDDVTEVRCLDGKRKCDVYVADLDTMADENGHTAKMTEKLARDKTKPWMGPAFGLFE